MGTACTSQSRPTDAEKEQTNTIRKQQEEIDRLTQSLAKQKKETETLKHQLQTSNATQSSIDDTDEEHDAHKDTENLLSSPEKQQVATADDFDITTLPTQIINSTILDPLDNGNDLASIVSQFIIESETDEKFKENENQEQTVIPHFRLLYRSSRDGDEAATFHRKCDEHGPTVTLIRDKDFNIFGGYNSLPWTSPKQSESRLQLKSFLFILKSMQLDGEKFVKKTPMKFNLDLSEPGNEEFATQDDAKKGPLFGISDLYLDNRFCSSTATNGSFGNCTYDMGGDERYLTPHEHFWVAELEVYAVQFEK